MPTKFHKPRKRKAAAGAAATPVAPQSQPPCKTILLVDDVAECRIMTGWFLANFGYTVVAARSAEEALALFDPESQDAVVTDNAMPGLTGAELAHIIKLRSPSTPVVMYTGLPPAEQSSLDVVIQKPAHLLTLKEALDHVLSPGHEPSGVSQPGSPGSHGQPRLPNSAWPNPAGSCPECA